MTVRFIAEVGLLPGEGDAPDWPEFYGRMVEIDSRQTIWLDGRKVATLGAARFWELEDKTLPGLFDHITMVSPHPVGLARYVPEEEEPVREEERLPVGLMVKAAFKILWRAARHPFTPCRMVISIPDNSVQIEDI